MNVLKYTILSNYKMWIPETLALPAFNTTSVEGDESLYCIQQPLHSDTTREED